jgi:hypothetical protein
LIDPLQVYFKQISRLSSSQGEFAKNLVPPWYFPKKFALFTLCSGVFTFWDLPILHMYITSQQIHASG